MGIVAFSDVLNLAQNLPQYSYVFIFWKNSNKKINYSPEGNKKGNKYLQWQKYHVFFIFGKKNLQNVKKVYLLSKSRLWEIVIMFIRFTKN